MELLVLIFGILVQRGVYLMLQRLKRREINRLIYPNLVSALQIIYEFLCKKIIFEFKGFVNIAPTLLND